MNKKQLNAQESAMILAIEYWEAREIFVKGMKNYLSEGDKKMIAFTFCDQIKEIISSYCNQTADQDILVQEGIIADIFDTCRRKKVLSLFYPTLHDRFDTATATAA